MNAALLIILLAHGGYWFAAPPGQNTIQVRWANPDVAMPAAVLSWQLAYGKLQLLTKDVELAPGAKPTIIAIDLPEPRVATQYTWIYQLKDKHTGKVLEEGQEILRMFPSNTLPEHDRQLKEGRGKTLMIVDAPDGTLASLLKSANIDATRVDAPGELLLHRPDIVLVAQDQLGQDLAAQEPLLAQARRGAGVMIFAQSRPDQLCGWPLRDRKLPADTGAAKGLDWRQKHPLFGSFDGSALDGWVKEGLGGAIAGGQLKALALPKDAPVLELGYWPRETPGNDPVPIDVLVATQTLGEGRIVYWQIPLSSWQDDPRAQILLANTLDYLLTRPEPTMPQAQRQPATRNASPVDEKQLLGAER